MPHSSVLCIRSTQKSEAPNKLRALWDRLSAQSRSYGDVTAPYVTADSDGEYLGEVIRWQR
jgi:hypothetical protein